MEFESDFNQRNSLIADANSFVTEWLQTAAPQAIFVTSGSLSPLIESLTTRQRPTGFQDKDIRGNRAWGRVRAFAAVELHNRFPTTPIFTTGAYTNSRESTTEAQGMIQELTVKGVSDTHLTEVGITRDTFTELLEVISTSLNNNYESTAVVTTLFQKPRAEAMLHSLRHAQDPQELEKIKNMMEYDNKRFGHYPNFTSHYSAIYNQIVNNPGLSEQTHIDLIPAEGVLPLRDPRYKEVLEGLTMDPDYKNQIALEEKGRYEWLQGTYGKSK